MKRSFLIIPAVLITGIVLGRFTKSHSLPEDKNETVSKIAAEYTCSMHPQIRQSAPGRCPICAMDLIPVNSDSVQKKLPEHEVALSPHAKVLAQIETVAVERRVPEAEIRLFGRIEVDESRQRTIAARFPARIERLYINYTGVHVREGDHLARIYSPELLTAQAELLSARRFSDERALRSAREKLLLWGLGENTIQAIQSEKEPSDTMEIDAPLGGFVMEKMVKEGDYVETGTPLFRIADLSTVWVVLDAYEMDTPWIRYGQPVRFTAEALPGQTFEGRIAFISPVLDVQTRTFKVRVNVENKTLQLRPGLFVTGIVHSRIAEEGVFMDPSLSAKWISPMHPEIIKDKPGTCDICGMDLVQGNQLGYVVAQKETPPLLVPASAVLQTGRRAIVYVEVPNREEPTYEGRVIELGPRAGDDYIVKAGLNDGERVVTQGAFKLDSTLQLLAKPSMMSSEETVSDAIEVSPEMREAAKKITQTYFPVWRALAKDNLSGAQSAAKTLEASIHGFHGLPQSGEFYETSLEKIAFAAGEIVKAQDIEISRRAFEDMSNALIHLIRATGNPSEENTKLAFCPMVFEGRRADWIQEGDALLNPYFGSAMLNCGEFESFIKTDDKKQSHDSEDAPHVHTEHSH